MRERASLTRSSSKQCSPPARNCALGHQPRREMVRIIMLMAASNLDCRHNQQYRNAINHQHQINENLSEQL
jgi:hypothetical protein